MRCKDNLQAAVLNHWRRHAVFKVEVKGERPVFVNDTRGGKERDAHLAHWM